MTATYVAGVISVFGAIGIIGRIVVGGIFDAKSVKGVSAMYLVLAAACLFALGVLNPYLLAAFHSFERITVRSLVVKIPPSEGAFQRAVFSPTVNSFQASLADERSALAIYSLMDAMLSKVSRTVSP